VISSGQNPTRSKSIRVCFGFSLKTPGQSGVTQFHLEQRHALTEEESLRDLMLWVNSKFEHDAELKPVQT